MILLKYFAKVDKGNDPKCFESELGTISMMRDSTLQMMDGYKERFSCMSST